jgi:hypothetical protein
MGGTDTVGPFARFSILFDSFGPGRRMVRVEPKGRTRPELHPMPLDPKRVQEVFLAAASYHDPADRAAILDRECMGDSESRKRIEALLNAHDRFNDFVNQPLAGSAGRARPWFA